MSSCQGGRGGRGRGGCGAHGGGQYDNQGHGSGVNPNWRGPPPQCPMTGYAGPLGGGQYGNQGRGTGMNPNWRGAPPQHHVAGYAGCAVTGQYPNHVRAQDLQQRALQDGFMGSQRGPGPQQMHAFQGSGAQNQYQHLILRHAMQRRQGEKGPQQTAGTLPAQYSAPPRGDQARGPSTDILSHLHQATQLMQIIPQARPMATGQVVTHEKGDAGLEEQISALTVQPMTPPPSGSSKAIKFLSRPGKGTRGQRVIIRTNHFLVQLSDKELHHYDVC